MDRCESCRNLMLEHLYDLLEEPDRQALVEHLAQCPACQAELEKARSQQRLLSAAAKKQFAEVQFEAPPRLTVPAAPTPVVGRATPRTRGMLRWAVAAGILLAAAGLAIPGVQHWNRYSAASGLAKQQETQIAHNQREMNGVGAQLRDLPQKRQDKLADVENEVREQTLKLEVSGPQTIQPGAHNEYRIAAKNLNDKDVEAHVNVRVRNLTNQQVVYEEKELLVQGERRLVLPRNLAVPPHTMLAMEVEAQRKGGPKSELQQRLELARTQYLTHLTTDKPMYQPGETVRFRSLTLERFSLKPAEEPFHLIYSLKEPGGADAERPIAQCNTFAMQRDNGVPYLGPNGQPIRGIGAGEYQIPPNASGGEYVLTVRDPANRFPAQERKFVVNRYQPPRLNKELEYARKSYGPGETVIALLKAARAEGGGEVANCPVEASILIDDKPHGVDGAPSDRPATLRTDDKGRVEVRFKLPAQIDKGDASLSVKFFDGANTETITRPIPIILKKLNVEFFPEGGDLVAGAPNRVYFQVRGLNGKPADLQGQIVDAAGKVVVEKIETLNDKEHPGANQGMGAFRFTPQADQKYRLKIESPANIEGEHRLPEVKKDGVVLSIPEGVFRSDEPVRAVIYSSGAERSLLVGGYCRGRLLDHQQVKVKKDESTEVILKPTVDVGGVYRVTVFEEQPGVGGMQRQYAPRAERLVYRKPLQRLELALHPDKKHYIPGEKVNIAVTGVTEDDVPAPAIIMVRVADRSVLTLADEKTARAMPTHFYMTTEVRKADDLEHADFLITAHPRAKEALDLLLGTQGWRRFAEQNPEEFRKKHEKEAEMLMAASGHAPADAPRVAEGQPAPETIKSAQASRLKVHQDFQKERAALTTELREKQKELSAAKNDADYRAALATMGDYEKSWRIARLLGMALMAAVLLVGAAALLGWAIQRGLSRSVLQLAVGGACGLLFLALFGYQAVQFYRSGTQSTWTAAATEMNKAAAEMDQAPFPMDNERAAEFGFGDKDKDKDGRFDDAGDGRRPALGQPDAAMPPMAPAMRHLEKQADERNRLKMRGWDGREAAKMAGDMLEAKADRFNNNKPGEEKRKELLEQAGGKDRDARRMQAFEREAGAFAGAPGGGRGLVVVSFVREFAHRHQPAAGGERRDFAETVYWHPVLVLPRGKVDIQFDLSDSVTSFEITAFGHTLDGRLGAISTIIESRLPFTLEPKVPIEVTASDKIYLPLSIANNTPTKRQVEFKVEHPGLKLLDGLAQGQLTLDADARTRRIFRFQPNLIEGRAEVLFEGKTEPFAADKIRRGFFVVPDGFPVAGSRSDMLEGVAINDLVLPESWIPGTLKVKVQVYPSTLASLQKGLESLLREPCGCFEQTSTSNYPNLLILDYLKENDLAKPEVDRRARELLGRGYQKLTSFECQNTAKKKKEGYEWFGGTAPAHEALTAYGLLQFRDMSRVHDVDPTMVERTRQYLMAQRDGKGGFKRNTRALDSFGRAPDNITNAYIVWALTESGKDDDLETELKALTAQAKDSKDPYFLALVANGLLNRDRADVGVELLKKVSALQTKEGYLTAEKTSITGSGGQSLQIETTSLAVLGWLKANRPAEFNNSIQNAVKWIGQQRGGYGGFGSTQSTILALKALIAFTKANKRPAEAGELKLLVGDQQVEKLDFGTDSAEALTLDLRDAEKHLKPGKNTLRVEMSGKNVLPYTLAWTYQTLKPASADGCVVRLNASLNKTKAEEGDAVRLTATIENLKQDGQGMAVAIIGLPAGLNVPENLKQLKDHCLLRDNETKPGLISAFELRGRELVLYWRDLAPGAKIEVPIDLECRIPGEFRGPASRAYLYYNPDVKHWIDPLQMTIQAKAE